MTQEKSIRQSLENLISLLQAFRANPLAAQAENLDSVIREVLSSMKLQELLKPGDLRFLCLKMYPDCYRMTKGKLSMSSLKRYPNWGIHLNGEVPQEIEDFLPNSANFGVPQQRKRVYIVGYLNGECSGKVFPLRCMYAKNLRQIIPGSQGSRVYDINGVACTQCAGSGGDGAKTGLYFIDQNVNPKITDHARCITARQDSGVSKRIGEHSGVLVEDLPIPVINPAKESARQNGRRIKNPDESMFTITVQDRHGVIHKGRIRKLMPIECWRLQGFTDEQFYKVQNLGMADSSLYKMAGNAVSVPVIKALGERIKELMNDESICKRG